MSLATTPGKAQNRKRKCEDEKGKQMNISAFFPAYNEAENLPALTEKMAAVLKTLAEAWEIIIVDDGSRDSTPQVAEALVKRIPGVRYLRHHVNQGYGGAVKTGLTSAKYEWIFFTDGDGQFDPQELALLIPHTQDADFVAGYRIKRRDNLVRTLNAFAWGTLVRTLFGLHGKVRDIDCAFKLFRREVVDKNSLQANGAMISTELLVRSKQAGYRFREQGVHHYPRLAGKQTGAKWQVILRAFRELFRFYFRIRAEKKR
jgi:glycosyltransferase involved in cell wall biosynthesis